jgi:hypothetical protein
MIQGEELLYVVSDSEIGTTVTNKVHCETERSVK